MLISVEGVDCAGKSSLVKSIAEYLNEWPVRKTLLTSDFGWPFAIEAKKQMMRCQTPYEEMLHVVWARSMTYNRIIKPAIENGCIVITDRFSDSTIAYQGAKGVDIKYIKEMHTYLNIPVPDFTFYIDVSNDEMRNRLQNRGSNKDKFESEDDSFFDFVRRNYEMEFQNAQRKVFTVDGNRPFDQVEFEVVTRLEIIIDDYTEKNLKNID